MLLSLLLMLSFTANATEEAKFTFLEYKAPAPFAGILFDEKAMAKMGMGALMSVGQGSANPPRFICMEYNGRKREQPLAVEAVGLLLLQRAQELLLVVARE